MKKISVLIKTEMYDAFIFDMDGLLFDTEKICWNCFKEICSGYGYDPDFEIYKKCIGRNTAEGNKLLEKGFGSFIPYAEANRKWNDLYISLIEKEAIPLKEGAHTFLKTLAQKNLRTAVATSTDTGVALKKLKKAGILNFFEKVTGGDTVKKSKPDPAIYLNTATALGAEPKKCIVFEDSENGVRSAYAAGMTIIQIPDLIEPSEDIRSFGHTIVQSFKSLELI
ncbi:MAG: HAD family phosphatase [Candidatus Delongbacteria bacterium]